MRSVPKHLMNVSEQHCRDPLGVLVFFACQQVECDGSTFQPLTASNFSNRKQRSPVVRNTIESAHRQRWIAGFYCRAAIKPETRELPTKLLFTLSSARVESLAQFARLSARKLHND